MARVKESEMKKKKAAAGRVSKSSHGNHHDLDVDMIEKKLGKKMKVNKKAKENKKGSYDPYAVESDEDTVPIGSTPRAAGTSHTRGASARRTRWGGIPLAVWRSVASGLSLGMVGRAYSTSRRPRTQRAGTEQSK
jgi:hypothetical protein